MARSVLKSTTHHSELTTALGYLNGTSVSIRLLCGVRCVPGTIQASDWLPQMEWARERPGLPGVAFWRLAGLRVGRTRVEGKA